MRLVQRAHALLSRGPRGLLALAVRATLFGFGFNLLVKAAIRAQGGRDFLWRYSHDDRHRFTAMAMLHHTLRLRNALSTMTGDEQVYNGAAYTNWGFGVPLLQMPFHAVARHYKSFPGGFFPDRAIYFIYLTGTIFVMWLGMSRLLAIRRPQPRGWFRRDALAWAAVFFAITYALFPLMSGRFIVYEETICYLILVEFVALSAYIFSLEKRTLWPMIVMGAAAGMGLVIRPTGVIYLGVWGILVLLERKTLRSIAAFTAATVPFFAFWMYSNWVRSGSPLSIGYMNAMPWFPWHTPMQRFGTFRCTETMTGTLDALDRLYRWFFVSVSDDPTASAKAENAFLSRCHFMSEVRPPANTAEPFFGLGCLVFLVWTLAHHLVRRERRLEVYVPFAAFAFMFYEFSTGPGFAWRYAGDVWPALVLIGVHFVRTMPPSFASFIGLRLAFVLGLLSFGSMGKDIETAVTTIDKLDDGGVKNLDADFKRSLETIDPPMPSQLKCGHVPWWPYHNGHGWNSNCTTDTFTNFFLGVPKKNGRYYQVRFETEGVQAHTLRLYLNGRVYTARHEGDGYVADVRIDYAKLNMPTVMGTIEWTQDSEPKPGKLLSVEIV
jgi:hypothetical protein